jgi:CheY-like chemotaxis protein/HPt (histidine-containing phosphotransfer) domain-containing protein
VKQAQLHDVVLRVLEGPKPVKSERKIIAPQRLDSSLATRLPLKILVADDNVINQKVAVRLFQQMGYKVDCVSNGLQAVEAVDQHHYNVVFMDVQMPELDGLEATRRIRQGEKLMGISARESCVIIAMTANAMKGDREKCIDSGMHDYIAKPVRPEAIQETLERWGTFVRDAEKARMESNAAANSSRPSMADGRSPALARPATTPPAMDAHGNTMPQTPPMAVEQSAQPPVAAEVPAAKLDDNMPPVDMGRLMQFADGDIDALKEIIQLYLNQTMGHLDELEAAVNDKSIPDIMRMAHKSAGSSSTCGINAIVPPLRQMERNAHEGHISSAPQLMLQARQELGRIRQYFASQNLC